MRQKSRITMDISPHRLEDHAREHIRERGLKSPKTWTIPRTQVQSPRRAQIISKTLQHTPAFGRLTRLMRRCRSMRAHAKTQPRSRITPNTVPQNRTGRNVFRVSASWISFNALPPPFSLSLCLLIPFLSFLSLLWVRIWHLVALVAGITAHFHVRGQFLFEVILVVLGTLCHISVESVVHIRHERMNTVTVVTDLHCKWSMIKQAQGPIVN